MIHIAQHYTEDILSRCRLSRVTVLSLPYHVAQRADRRQAQFVEPGNRGAVIAIRVQAAC